MNFGLTHPAQDVSSDRICKRFVNGLDVYFFHAAHQKDRAGRRSTYVNILYCHNEPSIGDPNKQLQRYIDNQLSRPQAIRSDNVADLAIPELPLTRIDEICKTGPVTWPYSPNFR